MKGGCAGASCVVNGPVKGGCAGTDCVVIERVESGMVGCGDSDERSRFVGSLLVERCVMVWLKPFVLRHWMMGCV